MSGYTIRQFQPADTEAFCQLFDTVFEDPERGRAWFEWKYRANPYLDHVPILLAETGGEVVGARPFLAVEMSVDGDRCLALQPCDTMVHPDHRREGLFTRLTERAIERYGRGDPAFLFNFPNEQSRPGYLNLGWEPAGALARWYRIQTPAPVLGPGTDTGRQVARSVAAPLVTSYNRLCGLTASSPAGGDVRRESGVPATALAAIGDETSTGAIHAVRDEQFYEWRFDNPCMEYTTYVTTDAANPVALVTGRPASEETGEPTATRIVDIAPLSADRTGEGTARLLDCVLSDNDDSDLLVAPSCPLPSRVLRRRGFQSEDTRPMSYVRDGRQRVVRGLGGWKVNGLDIRRAENWLATFAEMDTY